MKTITLKTDDTFFNKVSNLAKELHLSKSELIRRSVAEYETVMIRRKMKEQFKIASLNVRKTNRKINDEFEHTIHDGLSDV